MQYIRLWFLQVPASYLGCGQSCIKSERIVIFSCNLLNQIKLIKFHGVWTAISLKYYIMIWIGFRINYPSLEVFYFLHSQNWSSSQFPPLCISSITSAGTLFLSRSDDLHYLYEKQQYLRRSLLGTQCNATKFIFFIPCALSSICHATHSNCHSLRFSEKWTFSCWRSLLISAQQLSSCKLLLLLSISCLMFVIWMEKNPSDLFLLSVIWIYLKSCEVVSSCCHCCHVFLLDTLWLPASI